MQETEDRRERWLVCGTRGKYNLILQHAALDDLLQEVRHRYAVAVGDAVDDAWKDWLPGSVIEGCCPNSPDMAGEQWAITHKIPLEHFPSHSGNYLRRNVEMVERATRVIAFWDGFSYGTAHTIAQAVKKGIIVHVVSV